MQRRSGVVVQSRSYPPVGRCSSIAEGRRAGRVSSSDKAASCSLREGAEGRCAHAMPSILFALSQAILEMSRECGFVFSKV